MPASDPGSSPAFYAELLKSRDVLRRTVETRYAFATPERLDARHPGRAVRRPRRERAVRRDEAAKELLENIERDGRGWDTGTIDLKVTTPWAELSQQVAARMIQLVSDFNLHRRQTKAGAERRFVEARVAEARGHSARSGGAARRPSCSGTAPTETPPSCVFEYDRLGGQVNMQQQLYTSLAQSYEAARIEEVRNTPVITLMEPADLPAKPDPRLALVKGVLAGLVGLGLGAFIAAAAPGVSRCLRPIRRESSGAGTSGTRARRARAPAPGFQRRRAGRGVSGRAHSPPLPTLSTSIVVFQPDLDAASGDPGFAARRPRGLPQRSRR